jgi:hypothetical protein
LPLSPCRPRCWWGSAPSEPNAPVGLFIGAIEEGARIFTPVRLLPFEHSESLGHDFPTVLQLHGPEFALLLWLGERAGYRLWPTLEHYPAQPAADWPYRPARRRGKRQRHRLRAHPPDAVARTPSHLSCASGSSSSEPCR